MTGEKTVCRRALLCLSAVLFLLCIHPARAYGKTSVPAYLKEGVIVHACGGLNGNTYTNSLEALKETLEKGVRCVEIDFAFTSDGVLVCNHGWKDFGRKAPTWKQYQIKGTIGGYTPMKAKTALKMLIKAKRTWLVVDTQEKDVRAVYREIVKICRKNDGKQYLKKIVPQLYCKSDYKRMKKIYPFKQWIFTLYKLKMKSRKDYKAIAQFCRKNRIRVMTMATARLSKAVAKTIHKKGILVAVHTVNKETKRKKFLGKGANAIYSDYLY